ncbi:MAG: hypothetical protein HRT94_09865 [Alphaproteobacteria bacterium]|nr:hypothetical protein [Alphaproteobacteria bacterium]
MNNTKELLTKIDGFLTKAKMKETTFGRLSVNDGKFVSRLREGGRCWPETTDKVISFISNYKFVEAAK